MGLKLHKTLGLNPRLSFCPRCGGEATEIILLGALDFKKTCPSCGCVHFGGALSCGKCGASLSRAPRVPIGDGERLPASAPCATCAAEIASHAAIVAGGGVYWMCSSCGAEGVIKVSVAAMDVRRAHGLSSPIDGKYKPCGVRFTSSECPVCHGKARHE